MNENEQYQTSPQPEEPEYTQPPVYGYHYDCAYGASAPQSPLCVGQSVSPTPILVMGILSLAFASSFYFSFLGIVFGVICKVKLNSYFRAGGMLCGQARVGKILGKVGLILGIVLTALFVVWLTFFILAIVNSEFIFDFSDFVDLVPEYDLCKLF